MTADLLVARQPIYDGDLKVAAYKLLVQQRGSGGDEEAAVASALADIGLHLVMGRPAYVRASRSLLLDGHARALPSDRVVLEVSPELGADDELRAAIGGLARAGYEVALDGFVFGGQLQKLLPVASVAKVDVGSFDGARLRYQVDSLREYDVTLLAANVERHTEAELCRQLGFDLLQGDFLCKPRIVGREGVRVDRLNRLRLVAALQSPDATFDELQQIVARDVGLSYELLRFINSAFFSLPRRVDSVREALVMLGVRNVRRWSTLMTLAGTEDKPAELLVTGLVRARMCELLAEESGHGDPDGCFTAGMFSVLDALMDRSMVEVLAALPLAEEAIGAILNHDGATGRILRAVLAYERGRFGELDALPPLGTPVGELYARAVDWAGEARGALASARAL